MQWTNEQWSAIQHEGENLLVSAAAGSGKTAVLVERIMRLLCDRDPVVDADRLLVVTFTNAAAAEMRQKIERALRERIAKDPKNTTLRRQQMLLHKAQISTVHAFCQSLLHRYFYACDVDPSFSIIDTVEGELLRKAVLAELIEERMEHSTKGFRRLTTTVCRRGDAALHETVLQLHSYFSALPFFKARLQEFCDRLAHFDKFEETLWGRYLLDEAGDYLEQAKTLNEFCTNYSKDTPGLEKYVGVMAADAAKLSELKDALKTGWDALYNACADVKWDSLPACKAEERTVVQENRKRIKDAVKNAGKVVRLPAKELEGGLRAIAPAIATLCELVIALDEQFSAAKKERATLDFADLERRTLALLYDDEGVPSALSAEIRALFDAVLVDEYQDTNDVQELIFKAVSNGKNLFTVGDVKQSIYSFRGAVPKLFMDRAKRYESGGEVGTRIDLNCNFRSRSKILRGINEIFEKLMTANSADLVYDDREALVFGQKALYDPETDPNCRLCVLEVGDKRGSAAKAVEANWVSEEILRMIREQTPVMEKGTPRPMRFSDVAVLFRSDRLDGQELLRAFKEKGIPVVSERGPAFFEQTEVQLLVSLLQIIDNPMQDIPLLAVLRSPVAGFDEDRLLRLRADYPEGNIYSVLKQAEKAGDRAVYAVLKRLSDWRDRAAQEPLHKFLQELLYETDLDLFYGVQPGGSARVHRLQHLVNLAAAFEEGNHRGLSAFVRRLNTMAEKGQSPETSMLPETDNAVKLLSIHKSKGLEFPVVFVCGLQKRLSHVERGACTYHKQYGIAVDALDTRLQIRYPTAVAEVIRRAKTTEETNEELRILYVALTRAKEHLILTGTMADTAKLEDKTKAMLINRHFLQEKPNYLDWVLAALAYANARPYDGVEGEYDSWKLSVVKETASTADKDKQIEEKQERTFPTPSDETVATLSYSYAYEADVTRPVKMTVTQLKRAAEENDGVQLHPRKVYDLERPKFLQETKLSGAEEGDLIHRCFEHLALQNLSAEGQLQQLVSDGWISKEEEAQVDRSMLTAFLESPLFSRLQKATALYREQSFETELDTALGRMLVQGIVDCYFEEAGELVVVDYKTDRVKTALELKERYQVQLDSYAQALEKLTGKRVKEKLIWAARLAEIVEV